MPLCSQTGDARRRMHGRQRNRWAPGGGVARWQHALLGQCCRSCRTLSNRQWLVETPVDIHMQSAVARRPSGHTLPGRCATRITRAALSQGQSRKGRLHRQGSACAHQSHQSQRAPTHAELDTASTHRSSCVRGLCMCVHMYVVTSFEGQRPGMLLVLRTYSQIHSLIHGTRPGGSAHYSRTGNACLVLKPHKNV